MPVLDKMITAVKNARNQEGQPIIGAEVSTSPTKNGFARVATFFLGTQPISNVEKTVNTTTETDFTISA